MRDLLARSGGRLRHLAERSALARALTRRRVAGETAADAVRVAGELAAAGLPVALEYFGEPGPAGQGAGPGRTGGGGRAAAGRAVAEYLRLLDLLAARGLARGADLVVGLGAFAPLGERDAAGHLARVCAAARDAGATVTLDLPEEEMPAERALAVHAALLDDHPGTGITIPACLRAAGEHCRALSARRVRLRRGSRRAPAAVAHRRARDIDRSYVRCLRVLMAGEGHPVIATRDRRMLEIASVLAVLNEREPGGLEYQLPYGVRPAMRLGPHGRGMPPRVHVPYGPAWYEHLRRRL